MGRTQIDFFSLDVEGAEEAILDSLPFDKVDIRLFVIEYLLYDMKIRAQRLNNLKRFFDKAGKYNFLGTQNYIDAICKKYDAMHMFKKEVDMIYYPIRIVYLHFFVFWHMQLYMTWYIISFLVFIFTS